MTRSIQVPRLRYDIGLNYGERDTGQYVFAYLGTKYEEQVRGFLLALALCNTVVVEELDDGTVHCCYYPMLCTW